MGGQSFVKNGVVLDKAGLTETTAHTFEKTALNQTIPPLEPARLTWFSFFGISEYARVDAVLQDPMQNANVEAPTNAAMNPENMIRYELNPALGTTRQS